MPQIDLRTRNPKLNDIILNVNIRKSWKEPKMDKLKNGYYTNHCFHSFEIQKVCFVLECDPLRSMTSSLLSFQSSPSIVSFEQF